MHRKVAVVGTVLGKVLNMKAIQEWLKGKKTYLICVGAVIAAVVAWSGGEIDLIHMIEALVAAIGGITLRAGVEKSG